MCFSRLRDLDQHLVAGIMSLDVVDVLEVVEIQHQVGDCHVALGRLGDQAGGGFSHRAAVEAPGQRIGDRQRLGLLLGALVMRDFLVQLAIAPPAEDDQRNVEQQSGDRDIVRRDSGAVEVPDDIGQNAACAADEHQDAAVMMPPATKSRPLTARTVSSSVRFVSADASCVCSTMVSFNRRRQPLDWMTSLGKER